MPMPAAQIADLLVGAVDLIAIARQPRSRVILDHHDAMLDFGPASSALSSTRTISISAPPCDPAWRSSCRIPASGSFPHRPQQTPRAVQPACGRSRDQARLQESGCRRSRPRTISTLLRLGVRVKTSRKTAQRMLDPIPLTPSAADGKLIDEVKQILRPDRGGRYQSSRRAISRRRILFARCGNPPFVDLGAVMEHSICMFVEANRRNSTRRNCAGLIDVAGVRETVLLLGSRGLPARRARDTTVSARSSAICSTCSSQAEIKRMTAGMRAELAGAGSGRARAHPDVAASSRGRSPRDDGVFSEDAAHSCRFAAVGEMTGSGETKTGFRVPRSPLLLESHRACSSLNPSEDILPAA
ncbi:hypothetical protein FQR65_LT20454 [Abscondita terminalis]|nr:hypothetical protein FQR65_LT20454 [Abscondita terminalis]